MHNFLIDVYSRNHSKAARMCNISQCQNNSIVNCPQCPSVFMQYPNNTTSWFNISIYGDGSGSGFTKIFFVNPFCKHHSNGPFILPSIVCVSELQTDGTFSRNHFVRIHRYINSKSIECNVHRLSYEHPFHSYDNSQAVWLFFLWKGASAFDTSQ